ncbi:MAG: hypothetical protein PHD04_00065 [Candidatus Pacebacteria bacterium]|nr:hypothetical protein [Candidatus Paceibacterota bacterium]
MDDNQPMGQMPVPVSAPVVPPEPAAAPTPEPTPAAAAPAPVATPEIVITQMPVSSHRSVAGYAIGGIVLLVVIALGVWYFTSMKEAPIPEVPIVLAPEPATTTPPVIDPAQLPALVSGNTTADIAADLSQIPDTSLLLDADAAAASSTISGI